MTSKTIDDLIAAKNGLDRFGRPKAADVEAYERAKAALNAEAKANWDSAEWHREQAAILAARLDYGFQFESLFPTYISYEQVSEDTVYEIRERRGLKVFWTARGGYIEESQLTDERYTFTRDTLGFHVSEFEEKLRFNYAESMEELASLGQQRMDAEINRRAFQLLQAAIPSTSPYYVNAAAGLTKTILDTAVREVHDAITPNNGGGLPPVTIVGRAACIDQISDVITDSGALYDPEGTAEIRRLGRIGVYRGANVVRLHNYTDENDLPYVPENELYVFGGNVGKFVRFGGVQAKAWIEPGADYHHFTAKTSVGGLIHKPEFARRIVIGNI